MNSPNLLIVFSDQHRWCDLGCAGNAEVISPHLDSFAAGGLQFNSAYSNCPLCVPARGTLLTGLHALKHRAIANDLPIDTNLESFGTRLKQAGYQTGYIGKWHLGGVPRDQAIMESRRLGFDTWKVRQCSHDYLNTAYHDEANQLHLCDGYEPEVQTDLALDFLDSQNAGSPWGLVLSWGPPHEPYDAVPEKYRAHFDPSKLSLRGNVPEELGPIAGVGEMEEVELREWLAGYYAHILALDEQFGRLIEKLKSNGQWENTLVIYTSDHGDLLGSHNMIFKQMPHEESSHIPLIVGGGLDELARGQCDGLISLVDLLPTVMNFLNVDFDQDAVDGTNLSRLLVDASSPGADFVYLYSLLPCHYAVTRGDASWRAIRTEDSTFAYNTDTGSDWLLFDNRKDPLQQTNLIHASSDLDIATLRKQLFACIRKYDGNLSWQELIQQEGFVDAWNHSQRHFNRPEFVGRAKVAG